MVDLVRFPLPTDTAHVRIESRQYRIFRFDLGEGIVRWKAAVAVAIVAPYWVTLLIFGVTPLSGTGRGGVLFIFPAVVLVWAALRPDAGGRPRYTLWLDQIRFTARRRRPMIATPLARLTPGIAFIVTAQWAVLDASAMARRRTRHASAPAAVPAKVLGRRRLTPSRVG